MKRRIATAFLGSISLAALCAPAHAASVETVVVTAEKRTEDVKNVPMAVTVLGEDQLSKLNAISFADYANTVPGLNFTATDPGHTSLSLRGINTGGVGSTLGIYIDDTPYGSSSSLANGTISTPNIDTFDISRIEILRGPQGTLYGSSTLGGLLKFVPNAPSTQGFDDKFEVGGTDLAHGGNGYSVKGMVNIGLSDTAAIRVTGYHDDTAGFIDDPGRSLTNLNGVRSTGGRASFLFRANEDLSFRVSALMQDMTVGNDSNEDVTVVGGKIVPLYGDYLQQRRDTSLSATRYRLYNFTTDWDLGWGALTSSTSYGTFNDRQLTDATGVYGTDLLSFLGLKKFTEEARIASPADSGPLDWLFGVYYTNETGNLHQDLSLTPTGPVLGSLELQSRYTEEAAFANVTYHFTDRFDIGFGGRYSHNSQTAFEFGLASAAGASKGNVFTWSVAPRFHLDDQTVLYARVAKGYRPGGPNVLPPPPLPPGVPLFFGSDSLINYEAGVKTDLFDGKVSLDADLFLINWSDIQLLIVSGGYGVNANGGSARSQGFEWNIGWHPIDQFSIGFSGAYIDAHLTSDTDPLTVGAVSGDRLPWSARWNSYVDAQYTFDPMGDFTPFVGAGWRYVGNRKTDFNPAFGQTDVPAYNTIDARIGAEWGDWSVELYGKNLGDTIGFTAFNPSGTSALSGNSANAAVTQPREFGITVRGKI